MLCVVLWTTEIIRTRVGHFHRGYSAHDLWVRESIQLLVRSQVKEAGASKRKGVISLERIGLQLLSARKGLDVIFPQSNEQTKNTKKTYRQVESSDPVTNWFPDCRNLTEFISLSWPLTFSPNSNAGSGCRASHTRAVVSHDPETNKFGSVGEISGDNNVSHTTTCTIRRSSRFSSPAFAVQHIVSGWW